MNISNSTIISDPRRQAALLYWQGFSVRQIGEMLSQKTPTVQSWKTRDQMGGHRAHFSRGNQHGSAA
jgi:uncharacterized protein YjcR